MKILLLTSVYPISNVKIMGSTSVCHYFVRDWIKEGHEVKVINTYTTYCRVLHWISKLLGKRIQNRFPVSINTTFFSHPFEYNFEDVSVLLSPTYKAYPHKKFSKKSIVLTVKNILNHLSIDNFIPDVIIGHFLYPAIEIIPELKKTFFNAKTAIVLHGKISNVKDKSNIINSNIDWWGFRSIPIKDSFQRLIPDFNHKFFCFSGIPEKYIYENSYIKHTDKPISKFLFVGNLIERKCPVELLQALVYSGINFTLKYIGDGNEKKKIIKKMSSDTPNVKLLGRIPRDNISTEYFDAECFIMISRDETFGLVYLEAMAKGCITVASYNEGMDGIIQNGVNGFLCPSGDIKALTKIIQHITSMTKEEKQTMAKNAIETVKKMTDKIVSNEYLSTIERIKNSV